MKKEKIMYSHRPKVLRITGRGKNICNTKLKSKLREMQKENKNERSFRKGMNLLKIRRKNQRQKGSDSTTSESLSIESADSSPLDGDFEDVNEEDDLPYQPVNFELINYGE
ncbi:hypothetical protein JTB14_017391 [Gonioctena quinquepunctata]|nr:hypothetical protein JTB14_017391 [Gonioctena quinquepunctata]